MIVVIEIILLCILFSFMVYIMSKNPITTLYNYPPKVQEKVKNMKEYKDKIPAPKNKIIVKSLVSVGTIILISLILRYINGYKTFTEGFGYAILIWTIVNVYDVFIIDICWFCHSPKFVFKGTEDMIKEYRNYWFHIKEGLIGQLIGTIICLLIGLIVGFIL